MTLYRVELREAVAAAILAANTTAETRVYTARTMPSRADALPNVYIQSPTDRAESLNRGSPQFVRTGTITVIARVAAASGPAAESLLDVLTEQIELAVVSNNPLMQMITQISSMETGVRVNAENNPVIGEAMMNFYLEWMESFAAPPSGGDLVSITGTMQSGGNANFADMGVSIPQS